MNILSVFKREIISLKSFAKRPVFEESNKTGKQRVSFFTIILLIDICLCLFVIGLLSLLNNLGFEEVFESHKLEDLIKELSPLTFALLVIILIPSIEEVIFRLHLKYREWVVNILLTLSLSGIIYFLLDITGQHAQYMIVLAVIILLFAIYLIRMPDALNDFWKSKFPIVFYATTLIFALVHVLNYEFSQKLILIIPLLIAPQFIVGFLIGYLRIKLGFVWGLVLHASHNAVFILPVIISLIVNTNNPVVTKQNEYYQLTIAENSLFSNKNRHSYISVDSIIIDDYSLKKCVGMLLNIDSRHIETNGDFEVLRQLDISYVNNDISQSVVHTIESSVETVLRELKTVYDFEVVIGNKEITHWNLFISDEGKFEESYNSFDDNISTYNYVKNSL